MPLRLIYGCILDQNVDYRLIDGSVIDGWSLINVRLKNLIADGPFEIIYYGDHSIRGYALIYENIARGYHIDLQLEQTSFHPNQELLMEYKSLLQTTGLEYTNFKPKLLVLIG